MLFQVTPETQPLLCLLIMAVSAVIAQCIGLPESAAGARAQQRHHRPERRRRARGRTGLRVIHTH